VQVPGGPFFHFVFSFSPLFFFLARSPLFLSSAHRSCAGHEFFLVPSFSTERRFFFPASHPLPARPCFSWLSNDDSVSFSLILLPIFPPGWFSVPYKLTEPPFLFSCLTLGIISPPLILPWNLFYFFILALPPSLPPFSEPRPLLHPLLTADPSRTLFGLPLFLAYFSFLPQHCSLLFFSFVFLCSPRCLNIPRLFSH